MKQDKSKNKPLILEKNIVCFDCCDTLVLYDFPHDYPGKIAIIKYENLIEGDYLELRTKTFHKRMAVNTPVVDALKKHKKSGHSVVVWSAGGWRWAKGVVESLGLEEYVDVIMDKPMSIYDDLDPFDPKYPENAWMPKRNYPLLEGWEIGAKKGGAPYYAAKCMKGKTCEKCGKGRYKHFKTEQKNPHKLYCVECNWTIDKWRNPIE